MLADEKLTARKNLLMWLINIVINIILLLQIKKKNPPSNFFPSLKALCCLMLYLSLRLHMSAFGNVSKPVG